MANSVLVNKSNQSYTAGIRIYGDGESTPNPAVHCFYYSCVQLCKDILLTHIGETRDSLSKAKVKSLHSHIERRFYQILQNEPNETANKFKRLFSSLRTARELADYDDDKCYRIKDLEEMIRSTDELQTMLKSLKWNQIIK